MDGETHGKPSFLMDDLGETHYFRMLSISLGIHLGQTNMIPQPN